MPGTQRSKLETASWLAVVRAYNECNRRYGQLLRGFDLTIPQFDVLTAIANLADDATPKAIADELVVTRGNVSGVLQRLNDRGLIETRLHATDGRSFVCRLTHDGERLMQRARTAAALFIEEQLSPFDDARLRDTEDVMKQMQKHLRTIEPDKILQQT